MSLIGPNWCSALRILQALGHGVRVSTSLDDLKAFARVEVVGEVVSFHAQADRAMPS